MVQQFTRKGIPTPDPIPAGSISNGQLGDMNPWTIKMRDSDTAGPPQDRRIDDLTGEPSPDQNTLLLGMDLAGGGLVSINVNDLPSGGGGGVTGGDNVGGELGEVFKGLNGNIMEFRTLGDAGGTRMLIVTDGPNDRLTLDVNELAVDHDNLLNYDANEHAAPKRSLTLDGGELQLVGDEDTPANAHYYGTNGAGTLGYHDASELVIQPTGGVFGGTPLEEGELTQMQSVGITHTIQTIGVTGTALSGHLGDTSIHFADTGVDNNHYLRRNNAWVQAGDLALQDQIGSGQIIDGTVTNTDLALMDGWTIKLRNNGTTGPPEDVTIGALTTGSSPVAGEWLMFERLDGTLRKLDVNELAGGGGTISNAYATMTDGTTPANASGEDTFTLRGGTGIDVVTQDNDATFGDNALFSIVQADIDHGQISGVVADEHLNHQFISIIAGTALSGGGTITTSRILNVVPGEIDHDSLGGVDPNQHIAHSGVVLTAGDGLTGGGDISASRTFDVVGVNSIVASADDIQLVGDSATPGGDRFYGTNGAGVRGFYPIPAGVTEVNDLRASCEGILVDQVPVGGAAGDVAVYTGTTGSGLVVRQAAPTISGPSIQTILGIQTLESLGNDLAVESNSATRRTFFVRNVGVDKMDVQVDGLISFAGTTPANLATFTHSNLSPQTYTFPDASGTVALESDIIKDHGDLTSIGVNTHAQIDDHINDGTIHFTEASINHANIQGVGTNTHAQIDNHIGDATIHFTEASIDHGSIAGLGDDDHPQYFNQTRGDARYYPRLEADATFLKEIVEDTTPQLGGDLETLGQIMLFTGAASEPVGRIYNAVDGGVAIQYDDGTTPELTDGAVHVAPGFVKTYGASLNVDPLQHTTDGGQQVYVSENGMLFGVDPPPPQWEQETTDTGTYDLGAGAAEGPEVELTGLAMLVSGGADVQPGDRLIVQTTLYIRNATTNRSTSVQLGFGKGSNTSGFIKSQPIPPGFSGYVTVSLNTTVSVPIVDGDTVNVYARRGPGDHPQSQPIIDGALGTHEFYLAEQAAGGGGPVVEINDLESFTSGIVAGQVPVGIANDQCQYTDTTGTGLVVRQTTPTLLAPVINTVDQCSRIQTLSTQLQVTALAAGEAVLSTNNTGAGKYHILADGELRLHGGTPSNVATITHTNLTDRTYLLPDADGTFELTGHGHVPADLTVATDRLVGRDAAGTGPGEELTVGGGLEFTGSGGIQRGSLTGDVTASAGSSATTVQPNVVDNTKLSDMAAWTLKVRNAASSGDPQDVKVSGLTTAVPSAGDWVLGEVSTGEMRKFDVAELISGAAPVDSVFGRTGVVVAEAGDYTHAQLGAINADEHVPHSSITITAGDGLTGGGTIDSNVSLAAAPKNSIQVNAGQLQLVNDQALPAGNSYYGTNSGGTKGWHAFPAYRVKDDKSITINREPEVGERIGLFKTLNQNYTISAVHVYQLDGTSVTFNIAHSLQRNAVSPLYLFSADQVVTSQSGTVLVPDVTLVGQNRWVWIEINGVAGSVGEFHATIEFERTAF